MMIYNLDAISAGRLRGYDQLNLYVQPSRMPEKISPYGALAKRKQTQTMYILEAIATTRLRDILS